MSPNEMKGIAIVGMGGVFPDASNVVEFWENILNKRDCIHQIKEKESFWRINDYYDAEPGVQDKTYCTKAGMVSEIRFDPVHFGIPPTQIEVISTAQLFALHVAEMALADAHLLPHETSPETRRAIGVILGVGGTGEPCFDLTRRLEYPKYKRILEQYGLPQEMVDHIVQAIRDCYPQ